MINYEYGDVVLVKFVFSDGSGVKLRPALVISAKDYNDKRQELVMAAITSNIRRQLFGDTKADDWKSAGLLRASLVTAVIRTIKQSMVVRKLGTLSRKDLHAMEKNLKRVFGHLSTIEVRSCNRAF